MSMNAQSIFYLFGCLLFCYIAWMYTKILMALRDENVVLKRPLLIRLDEEDLSCLVRGGILKVAYFREGRNALINLALSDIGYERMQKAIENAMLNEKDNYKEHRKIIQ